MTTTAATDTTAATTFERLRTMLARDYGVDPAKLSPDALLEDLGIDSLGAAELLFNIEDEFGIRVSTEPVPLKTAGEVVGYIDALVEAQRGAGR